MDGSAYLRKHGWRGTGHSLDHTDRGIKKPLLISKKVDVLGVGLKKHAATSDQWWLRAFDEGLRNLGSGQESALGQVQKHGVSRGGLYAHFVRGGRMPGSIPEEVLSPTESAVSSKMTCVNELPLIDGRTKKAEFYEPPSHNFTSKSLKPSLPIAKRKRKRDLESEPHIARRETKQKTKTRHRTIDTQNFGHHTDPLSRTGSIVQSNGVKVLPKEKLMRYVQRAAKKGMSVEDYTRRRLEKRATKLSKK